MIRWPAHSTVPSCALLTLAAIILAPRPASAQAPGDSPPGLAPIAADAHAESGGRRVWTCAMHPHVRQAHEGKCPICAMELLAVAARGDRTSKLLSLQEMLAIALRHNPNIRAARGRVQVAEAELDRTRFDVLQQILAFREKREQHRATLQSALQEFRQAQSAAENGDPNQRQAADALAAAAREKYFLLRVRLGEIEAELPFLLGRAPDDVEVRPADAGRRMIREELLPKAREIVQLRLREYNTGNAGILDVLAAQRQLAEWEGRLATTRQQRIAAVESQKELLQQTRDVTAARYRTGEGSQGDLLAIELELSKLDLKLLELKGE